MKVKLKSLLKKKSCLGTWVTIPHRSIVEIAAFNGFDWVCFDIEHTSINLDQLANLISISNASNLASFVRLSNNDATLIKRVMDAGSSGIIVPMINTKEEALQAYEAMHYPPRGKRGLGLSSAQVYGAHFENYKTWLQNEAALIVQIEHTTAVQNLESILSLDEVDGFIVGPYDLSASLGKPGDFKNPEFIKAMEKIVEVQSKFKKARGIHSVDPSLEQLKENIEKGFNFIGYSFEAMIIEKNFKAASDKFKELCKS